MRLVLLTLLALLAGCLQQCPACESIPCECPPCDCPACECPEPIKEECTAANITTITVNGTINETNITEPEIPEQKMEGIPFANYLLVLDDVSYPTTSAEPCGIFSIVHAENQSIADRLIICPGDSKNWMGPEGHGYRILVKKVAAGYTKESMWADVIIFG